LGEAGDESMADLNDGESLEMKGSGAKPLVLKNVGGAYSCTCPAWRNQSIAIGRSVLRADTRGGVTWKQRLRQWVRNELGTRTAHQ
jgi:hypothetical protein